MNSRYPVTLAIIAVNVVVFAIIAWELQDIMMRTNIAVLTLLNAGANLNPFTLGGQPWRIITSMFLHFGVLHLLVNMYGLYSLGQYLEPAIGKLRFLLLYMICGVVAGLASVQFNVFVISAGASGAIFGLYGYQLGAELISTYHDWEKLRVVLINFAIFVIVNGLIAGQVNVDMSGHIGGAVAGLIISFCHLKLKILRERVAMAVVLCLLPLLLFVVSHSQLEYYKIFQRFIQTEDKTNRWVTELRHDRILADSLTVVEKELDSISRDLSQIGAVPNALLEDTTNFSQYIQFTRKGLQYKIQLLREEYIYLDSIELVDRQLNEVPKLRYVLDYTIPDETDEPVQDTVKQSRTRATPVQVSYDEHWRETQNSINAKYFRIGTRDSLGRWQGNVRDYFANGELQMRGRYTDNLRDGIFIYYTDHQTYASAGRYARERAVGRWKTFHWNGKPESETYREPEYFMNTVWDSVGQTQVQGGNGEYKKWYANGNLRERGNYVQGKREGFWFGYHENGKPYYKEQYKNNRLISGASENSQGKRFVYDQLSEFPFPEMGMNAYRDYIEKNKRAPFNLKRSGIVKVIFTVGTDGALWDFVILEGLTREYDEEAIRLIREGPPWRPAFLHGDTKIQSDGYIEIKF